MNWNWKDCHRSTRRKLWSIKFGHKVIILIGILICVAVANRTIFHRPWVDIEQIYADLLGPTSSDFLAQFSASHNCQIPLLDPFDQSIMRLIGRWPRLQCRKLQPDLFYLERGRLRMNRTEWQQGGTEPDTTNCRYRCIEKSLEDVGFDAGSWTPINVTSTSQPSASIPCDVVHVECSSASILRTTKVYQNIFYQIVPKLRLQTSHQFSPTIPRTKGDESGNTAKNSPQPNVIVLVLDSMSRSHFIRTLPKTYRFLVEECGAMDFSGMMKVGLNTFPNIIPALTGIPGYGTEEFPTGPDGPYDDWPLDWFQFKEYGYVTLYGEDMTNYNPFQSYGAKGFRRQPTDHYMRPLFQAVQDLSLYGGSMEYCLGSVPIHKLMTDAILNMFKVYNESQPKYAHLHVSGIFHDDFNAVTSADDDLLEFLQALKANLENTFFFMLGDHGLRFGKIRESHLGQLENGLPLFAMTTPEWFAQKHTEYMDVLKRNSDRRLVSMFDFHATKITILQQFWVSNYSENPTKIKSSKAPVFVNNSGRLPSTQRGQSLFHQIPETRTCQQASIPEEFCLCETIRDIDSHHPKAMLAAVRLVSHLNDIVQSAYPDNRCAPLSLAQIIATSVILPNQRLRFSDGSSPKSFGSLPDLSISLDLMISVNPSKAIFQAKVRYLVFPNRFEVPGQVSRVNRYNNQSHCVAGDRVVVLYCFCQDQKM